MPRMSTYFTTAPMTTLTDVDGLLTVKDPLGTPKVQAITGANLCASIASGAAVVTTLAESGGVSLAAGTQITLANMRKEVERYYDVMSEGAVGNGVADDTAAIQAVLTALADGDTVVFPKGTYKTDGSLTIADGISSLTIRFEAGAWLAPTAGWGLKLLGNNALTNIENFRVSFEAGSTATRGLWLLDCSRSSIWRPMIWANATLPSSGSSTFIGIDVDNNSYWLTVWYPVVSYSGSTYGTYRAGIRFIATSNAGRVYGGEFSKCDAAVEVDGSNAIVVDGAAFENCTVGVKAIDPTVDGTTNGIGVIFTRSESTNYHLDLSGLTITPATPCFVFGTIGGTQANDPNGLNYRPIAEDGIEIAGASRAITFNGHTAPAAQIREGSGALNLWANAAINYDSDHDSNGGGEHSFRIATSPRFTLTNTSASFASVDIISTKGAGTDGGAGMTVVEYGDSVVFKSVITLTTASIAVTDGGVGHPGRGSVQVYNFPAGAIRIMGATCNVTLTAGVGGISNTFNGDFSLGTVTKEADDTLDSTEVDILPKTATVIAVAGVGTAKGQSTATEDVVHDGTGTAKDAWLNVIIDDGDISSDDTLTVAGTITILWANLGDY